MLDSLQSRFYKARAFAIAAALLASPIAVADVVGGVQLPDGVQKVGENRFRTRDNFEGVMKYYRTVYPPDRYPRKSIVNQPGVKATHISNPSGKNFEGLNIYEANDEVRIFVVKASKK